METEPMRAVGWPEEASPVAWPGVGRPLAAVSPEVVLPVGVSLEVAMQLEVVWPEGVQRRVVWRWQAEVTWQLVAGRQPWMAEVTWQ